MPVLSSALEGAFNLVRRAIDEGPIPGAAAAIGTVDQAEVRCFGVTELEGQPVNSRTRYDLASLTKVLSTVPLLLRMVAAGQLDPKAPLRETLPSAVPVASDLGEVSVLELATHTAGLPWWQPLYSLELEPAALLQKVMQTSLTESRGRIVYSDLSYIVLGYLLECLTGSGLRELARRLHEPLGLGLAFGPVVGEVAPTEDCPWRKRLLRGEVHDENAWALGGVAGHAGLFGSVEDVARFAQALLAGRLLPDSAVACMAQEHAREPGTLERRGFGWLLPSPGWSGGDSIHPDRAIGHTGFTGTGLWIDLARGRFSVLLTNRVHPSRHVEAGITELRQAFNTAAHAE